MIARGKLVAQGPIGDLRTGNGGNGTLEEIFINLVGGETVPGTSLDWI